MKTPEEMAEEYAKGMAQRDISMRGTSYREESCLRIGFLAGYQAAKEETNLPTLAKWISVKDRLPSCGVLCAWISDTTQSCIARIEVDDMHPWYEGFDYWCELPEAPKGEG